MMASAIGSPSAPGPRGRRRGAPDRDPHRQRVLDRPRVDAEARRAAAGASAAPGHPLLLAQLQQQLQLLGEERVVVIQVVAEERKRLDEGAAPRHDLRAPAGEQVQRGELLEDAHRVVRAEHRHRAGQADARVRAAAAASTTAGAETT
jgi:hypothetical protein